MASLLPTPPQRVLIVRMSHLGDIAQTIPLVHALRASWPSVQLAWAVQPEFAGLIDPLVDEVIPFGRREGARAWPAIRRAMRQFSPDLVIDAQGNWKSAAAARLSGAPLRVGFSRRRWQEPAAARIFGVRTVQGDAAAGADGLHLVDRVLGIAGALTGAHGGSGAARLDAAIIDDEREGAKRFLGMLAGAGGNLPRIDVVLHPGAPSDPRSWSRENYRSLARELIKSGQRVLVLTGPAEGDVGTWMQHEIPGALHAVEQRGLRLLAALFGELAAGGAQLVCGDSGPAHVAASAGLPVVLIAGPEDPARTGPWPVPAPFSDGAPASSPHRVAGTAGAKNPDAENPVRWTPRSVAETTVEQVLAALENVSPTS